MVVKRIDGGLERVAMVGMFAEVLCGEGEGCNEGGESGERRGRTKVTNEGDE
jgi:hypothetical protein